MKKSFIYIITIGIIFILVSCSGNGEHYSLDNQTDSCELTEFTYEEFDIAILDYDDLPYVEHAEKVTEMPKYDINGVPLHEYEGRLDYHPVSMAQNGLNILDVYHDNRDTVLLTRLLKLSDKFIGISLEFDSTIFFPYSFDFALHGYPEDNMHAPWFSSMAQGQILSFYCRLFVETQDSSYLELSHKIFQSFLPLKGTGDYPWVSCVDQNGNLWLEEYPEPLPALTLNGMNFAIYGVYDYYRITKNETSRVVLMASLSTVKNNIERFKRENEISSYCIKHRVQSEYYHGVHIDQLHDFYLITGDNYFEQMSESFAEDFKLEPK